MNLTPHLQEKDMDQLRTEQVRKKKNEFHLIGQERRIKGHTLFCFNLVKREIKVAPITQERMFGLDGSVIYKNNVTVEKDCVYVQALNEKNAIKKLRKMGIDNKLIEMGAEEGDMVRILNFYFEFKD